MVDKFGGAQNLEAARMKESASESKGDDVGKASGSRDCASRSKEKWSVGSEVERGMCVCFAGYGRYSGVSRRQETGDRRIVEVYDA